VDQKETQGAGAARNKKISGATQGSRSRVDEFGIRLDFKKGSFQPARDA